MASFNNDNFRLFIAIKPIFSQLTLDSIKTFKENLCDSDINWINESNMHLTIYYLGNTESNRLEEVNEALHKSVHGFSEFQLTIQNTGTFGKPKPRILWLGIEPNNRLNLLYHTITENLAKADFKVDNHEYKPHITIGRIRKIASMNILDDLIEKYKNIDFQTSVLEEVILFQSLLTQKGPVYKPLYKFHLK